jgi:hypothetical protein
MEFSLVYTVLIRYCFFIYIQCAFDVAEMNFKHCLMNYRLQRVKINFNYNAKFKLSKTET